MTTITVKLKNETGLHARPAALVCKEASSFKSDITLKYKNKQANAKSLIGILSMVIPCGGEVQVVAEGEDEVLAAQKVAEAIGTINEA